MKAPYFLAVFGVFISSPLGMAADDSDAQRPHEHFCPIILQVMIDPVITLDGNSYERIEILRWLQKHPESPITRMPIDTTVIPNHNLRKIIEDWSNKNTSGKHEDDAPRILNGIVVPKIVIGHEEFYLRFIKGKLIYRPNSSIDVGRIELPFAALANPLEGAFDLSQCGDAGQYLSISTGYRRQEKSTNTNKIKVWIAPKFMMEKELSNTTQLLRPTLPEWTVPRSLLGMFFTWGALELTNNNYLIILDMANLSSTSVSDKCAFDLVW